MRVLLALSGPVGVGKSRFCDVLKERFGVERISTRELLLASGAKSDREDLQAAGERADRDTDGKWVADALIPAVANADSYGVPKAGEV
jgi:adenylate kinase family enzyme